MINANQMHPQLSDYALGLLTTAERKAVESHTANCPTCQEALQTEVHLTKLVQTTIQTATHVENGRLQTLMPPLPTQKRSIWQRPVWQRQLASVCVLALLLFGGLGFYQANFGESHGIVPPTSLAITATNTALPTETAVADEQQNQTINKPTSTAVAGRSDTDQPIIPRPAATPIAFVNTSN